MATNYTTRTAALRATRADMRQVAVNKKIEIGTVAKDENGLPISGTAVDSSFVSTDKLYVTDTREGSDTQGKRTDVMDILDTMKNGIDIGTDTSEAPEDEGTTTNAPAAYTGVSKLNFRGEYVTVVEDPVTKEITLWLNKSTAYPEYKACPRTSGTNPDTTTPVTTYTHDTDNFAITAGGQKTACLTPEGTNFGSSTYTFKSAANTAANVTDGLTFRVSSSQALFVRTKYEGTASAWQKVDFGTKVGRTYTIANGYSTSKSTPFSGNASTYKTTTVGGITLTYSVHPLTSADAPSGRVPGTAECEMSLKVDWDTILTKDGGTASLQIAFDKSDLSAPSDSNIVNLVNERFFSEKKTATCAVPVISYNTKALNSTVVSGLKYYGSGSRVNVSVANIANTQWKTSNTTGNRATIAAANGTSKTFAKGAATSSTTGEFRIDDTSKANHSDAVYSIHDYVLTTGSESDADRGTCKVTCTPISVSNGTPQSATLKAYWYNIPKSTAKVENFGHEKTASGGYRMLNESSEVGSYDNTQLVTALSATIAGIETVPAVCQFGKLKHPANADVSVTGEGTTASPYVENTNPYSAVTKPASFVRKFTQDSACNYFTLEGTNLVQSKVSVYWFDDKPTNMKWRPLVVNGVAADGKTTISGNKITRSIATGEQEDKQPYQIIAIVMNKDASAISPITHTNFN